MLDNRNVWSNFEVFPKAVNSLKMGPRYWLMTILHTILLQTLCASIDQALLHNYTTGSLDGFIFEIADYFDGTAIFIEHRYYGESLPTVATDQKMNFDYLRISQVLGDVTDIITRIKSNDVRCPDAPVIVCGSSYSGALAVWMRIKYPTLIRGAIVSSAPLMYFYNDNLDMTNFRDKTAEIYLQNGCLNKTVIEAWRMIRQKSKTAKGITELKEAFKISDKSPMAVETDQQYLISYIRTALEQIALLNYPYAQDSPKVLAEWPVKAVCSTLNDESNDATILSKMFQATKMYYNTDESCIKPDVCSETNEAKKYHSINWQKCTEWIVRECKASNADNFIPNECGDCEANSEMKAKCKEELKDTSYTDGLFEADYIKMQHGINFNTLTNVVFTNGKLDPWNTGAVTTGNVGTQSWTRGVYVFEMTDAANQLDFRQPNSCDPPSVTDARQYIVTSIIPKMLANGAEAFEELKLSTAAAPNTTTCNYVFHQWQKSQSTQPPTSVTTTTSAGSGSATTSEAAAHSVPLALSIAALVLISFLRQ
uniref:Clan SC, family S28, unassigned serine peptidase n=1 Tax=Syphacia muris TaxID=451379 RepID=A0A0N5AXL1_9BILA